MKDLAAQSAELSRALEEANEASRLKTAFIANVSHEIRTPMNGLMGLLSLMLDRDLGPVERDYAETMSHSAESLMAIVNDVLDFSKLEARRVEPERELFSIHAAVADAVRSIAARAHASGVAITSEIANESKNLVLGDRLRLGQVLSNLLDNAVKFSDGGRVVLRVLPETNDRVRFEIVDSGIGIAAEGRDLLFESFTQADMSTTRRFGGTGLGLAICKQIVELMGGTIGVDSQLGAGSTFWFVLPLDDAELPDAPALVDAIDAHSPSVARGPADAPARATVLVAEDNEVNAKVAAATLRFLGYEPVLVRDGIEALDALERAAFDAVLMDVQMPRLNGYDTTRELRRRGFTLPVIAMTAMAQETDRLESLAAGMDDYVSKPISRRALAEALRRQVRVAISSN
jgi:CheY-like chemotaxis protein